MRILAIGDNHFRVDNIHMISRFIRALIQKTKEVKPDLIVLLGDILHDHERVHTTAMNKAYELIRGLRDLAPLYIIVGNHDMINHKQFLSDNHWMNALKEWRDVHISDKVLVKSNKLHKFIFCPYVAPGRFIEALVTLDESWEDATIIFAHQEFKGCKMGALISEEGDEWSTENPFVVSGHIHSKQTPQDNIFYPGSSMQVAYGESEQNIVALIDLIELEDGASIDIEEINLGLPIRKVVYLNTEEFRNYELPDTEDEIKLSLSGTYEDFRSMKKTKKFIDLINKGIKITFRHARHVDKDENITCTDTKDFDEILRQLIEKENDEDLHKAYELLLEKK